MRFAWSILRECDAKASLDEWDSIRKWKASICKCQTRNSTNSCSIIFLTAVAAFSPPSLWQVRCAQTENITVYNVVWSPTLQQVVHLFRQGYVLIRIYWMSFSAQFIPVVWFSYLFIQIDMSASLRRHDKCAEHGHTHRMKLIGLTNRHNWCCALEQSTFIVIDVNILILRLNKKSFTSGKKKQQQHFKHFKHFYVNKTMFYV